MITRVFVGVFFTLQAAQPRLRVYRFIEDSVEGGVWNSATDVNERRDEYDRGVRVRIQVEPGMVAVDPNLPTERTSLCLPDLTVNPGREGLHEGPLDFI
jgi:hypothetical protein